MIPFPSPGIAKKYRPSSHSYGISQSFVPFPFPPPPTSAPWLSDSSFLFRSHFQYQPRVTISLFRSIFFFSLFLWETNCVSLPPYLPTSLPSPRNEKPQLSSGSSWRGGKESNKEGTRHGWEKEGGGREGPLFPLQALSRKTLTLQLLAAQRITKDSFRQSSQFRSIMHHQRKRE